MKKILLLGIVLLFSAHFSYSQQNLVPGVPYTQSFDVLGTTDATWTDNATIPGWYAVYESTTLTSYGASTGSSTTGSLYSLGTASTTDRSLGSLPSGTTETIYFGVKFKNNTASEIKSLTVTFTGEQWRYIKNASAQSLTFSYQVNATSLTSLTNGSWTDVPELNFLSPNIGSLNTGSINGNDISNRTSISNTFNVSVPVGNEIMLRFVDIDDSGSDMALGIDDFSVTSYTTLPISLTSFTAKAIDKTILLNWATASEKNNQQFEVLKSVDGKNFKSIATVNGAGSSDTEKSYSFVDENPYAGANYYQLKQTDFNGATATSNIISANAKIEGVKLSAYASSNSVIVNINSPNQTDGEIALFDMNGRKLEGKNLILNKGYNEVNFGKFLVPGTYFVNLMSAGKSISYKFIK